ncbi:hypothetical protein Q8A73_014403 [Channa argus]|nr:hypothetical protein Q8A73_014403 [Channa argus]
MWSTMMERANEAVVEQTLTKQCYSTKPAEEGNARQQGGLQGPQSFCQEFDEMTHCSSEQVTVGVGWHETGCSGNIVGKITATWRWVCCSSLSIPTSGVAESSSLNVPFSICEQSSGLKSFHLCNETFDLIPITNVTHERRREAHVLFVCGRDFTVSAEDFPGAQRRDSGSPCSGCPAFGMRFYTAYLGSSGLRHVFLSRTNLPEGERVGAHPYQQLSATVTISRYRGRKKTTAVVLDPKRKTTTTTKKNRTTLVSFISDLCAQLLRIKPRDIWRVSAVSADLRGVTRCAPLWTFGRLEDRTALSPERPYLDRHLHKVPSV